MAVVNGTRVCVGTIEWLQRQGTNLTDKDHQLLQNGLAISSHQAHKPNTDANHSSSSSSRTESSSSPPGTASHSQPTSSQHPSSGGGRRNQDSSKAPAHSDSSGLGASVSEASSSVDFQGRKSQALGSSNSRVFVSVGGVLAGCIEVADAVRHDAARTVAELQSQGVRCIMLSGDIQDAAYEVALSVGIKRGDVFAGGWCCGWSRGWMGQGWDGPFAGARKG